MTPLSKSCTYTTLHYTPLSFSLLLDKNDTSNRIQNTTVLLLLHLIEIMKGLIIIIIKKEKRKGRKTHTHTNKANRLIHGSSHTLSWLFSFFSFLLLLFIVSDVCFCSLRSSLLCDFPFWRYGRSAIIHLSSQQAPFKSLLREHVTATTPTNRKKQAPPNLKPRFNPTTLPSSTPMPT